MNLKKILRISKSFDNKEEIILRDYLALERTKLANERTLLSYIRSSLYLLLGGIAILQLEDFESIKLIGYLALSLTIVFLVIGIYRFYRLKRILRRYYAEFETYNKKNDRLQ